MEITTCLSKLSDRFEPLKERLFVLAIAGLRIAKRCPIVCKYRSITPQWAIATREPYRITQFMHHTLREKFRRPDVGSALFHRRVFGSGKVMLEFVDQFISPYWRTLRVRARCDPDIHIRPAASQLRLRPPNRTGKNRHRVLRMLSQIVSHLRETHRCAVIKRVSLVHIGKIKIFQLSASMVQTIAHHILERW
nr:hypothetical protein [Paraburkholderia sacchari]